MPRLGDKLQDTSSQAELNPLTNPLLERNLGRWAKVYFSSPPAKRERAVSSLLEEIRRENGLPSRPEADRSYSAPEIKPQGGVCTVCHHQNPPGHKFCSRCGESLNPVPAAVADNPGATGVPQAAFSHSGNLPHSENDVQRLRDRSFAGLDRSEGAPRRGWKYVVATAAIVLAGFFYFQWTLAPQTRVASKSPTPAPRVEAAAVSLPTGNPGPAEPKIPAEESSPAAKAPAATNPVVKDSEAHQINSAAADQSDRNGVPSGIQPAVQKSPLLEASSAHQTTVDQGGASDLRLAQRYLGGGMGGRDSSEAAKLLWRAVSKQNASAAILLSDLYLRGDGVTRSCDQARLLLLSAAKRGSAPAAQQLRNLESRGCR